MTTPARPSHFRETPEERTELEPQQDYPTEAEVEVDDDYGWPAADMEPIPVYITEVPPVDQKITDWNAATIVVSDGEPIQLTGANRNRTRLLVRNNDAANSVRLSRDAITPGYLAYTLPAGANVEMLHNSGLWAACDAGETAEVSVLTEYDLKDVE